MAEAILTEVLKMLGSTLFQEMELVWGVKDELTNLTSTVSAIREVLKDAEEKQVNSKAIEDWLEKLNDALHEADDVLDNFSTQALRLDRNRRLKKVRNFFLILNRLVFRSKLAYDIKAVNKTLDAIAEEKHKFHLTVQSIDHMRVENFHFTKREETHSSVHAERIIGRNGDKLEIVELLLKNNVQENVSVVAIVGIGGLGKTALGQLVYNDKRLDEHFELKMWVCVSDNFDVKIVAKKIVESATDGMTQNVLMDKLHEKIDGRKFLLVLDDVWDDNHDKWINLIDLLMGGKRGSKILVTTRAESVAKASGTKSPYFLEGLSVEESWSLFKTVAFDQGEESSNTFKIKIGKGIVQKCKGVPLAIRAIGSLLHSKDTNDEWLFFKNNDFAKIAEEKDIIVPILKFDDLPLHLKRCFAFCSLYLKDEEIDKQELIQLWIAEGFIRPMYENQLLEDAGDLYFMDLLRRSLFQDVKRDIEGNIISCKMHDLVHDLAQSVAKTKFFMVNSNVENVTGRTRHVSLDSGANLSEKISNHLVRANKLRTFILKAQKVEVSDKLDLTFRRLRVLDLHSMGIEIVPSYISKLKHLRYLDLSENCCIKTLPSSITILINLQTLKLNGCSGLEELPRDFRRLIGLRHLELDDCNSLTGMPYELGHLTSLLTLTLFVIDSNKRLSELQSLNKLRGRLKVVLRGRDSRGRWFLKTATVKRIMSKDEESKEYLELLRFERDEDNELLRFENFERDEDNGEEFLLEALRPDPNLKRLEIRNHPGASFRAGWMMVDKIGLSLPNLVRIEIERCDRWKHLPPFGQLPSLQYLSVDRMLSLEYIDNSTGNGEECVSSLPSSSSGGTASAARRRDPTPTPTSTFFPSLKELRLVDLPNLKGWWRSEVEEEEATETITSPTQQQHQLLSPSLLPSFPSLSTLDIRHCPNLASVPLLQPCLETLTLGQEVSEKLMMMMMMVSPTISTTTTVATSSSSSSMLLPLSKLKFLNLTWWRIENLPEEWLRSLTSLQKLDFYFCHRLTSLSGGLRHLTALHSLSIERCEMLDLLEDDDGMQFQGLKSLTYLKLRDLDKLVCLPVGLQHLTTLKHLHVSECDKLKALPEWIGNLPSLEELTITSCRMLNDRCHKGTGEDWPKIARIPNVILKKYNWE